MGIREMNGSFEDIGMVLDSGMCGIFLLLNFVKSGGRNGFMHGKKHLIAEFTNQLFQLVSVKYAAVIEIPRI